jgi:hypothetical protein
VNLRTVGRATVVVSIGLSLLLGSLGIDATLAAELETVPPSDPAEATTAELSSEASTTTTSSTSTTTTTTLPSVSSTQDATHESTQTAVANTGLNVVVVASAAPAGPASAVVSGSSASGDAESTGTDDETRVQQTVVASVTDDGAVSVLQLALLVNIGLAAADTGSTPASVGGSAVVETGDALAVGNQAITVIDQAAVLDATAKEVRTAQTANSRSIGIAISNSGGNLVIGISGAGGSSAVTVVATSGGATAIGSRSTTDVQQIAVVSAGAGGVVDVVQQVVVANLGVALASSGGGVVGEGDQAVLDSLWGLIAALIGESGWNQLALPSGPAGASATRTGSSQAVGNQSSTQISQQVVAAALAGLASAQQDAVVANAGIAVANSGANGWTSSGALAADMDELDALRLDLAGFLDAMINAPTSVPALDRYFAFGDQTIHVDGSIATSDVLINGGDGATPDDRVRVRQVSGVLTIAISIANSTHGTTEGAGGELRAGSAVSTGVGGLGTGSLVTGMASAANRAISAICQRFQDSSPCRQPVVETEPTPDPEPGPAPVVEAPVVVLTIPVTVDLFTGSVVTQGPPSISSTPPMVVVPPTVQSAARPIETASAGPQPAAVSGDRTPAGSDDDDQGNVATLVLVAALIVLVGTALVLRLRR